MKEIKVNASLEELDVVFEQLDEVMDELCGDVKANFQLKMALEELFVNVVSYAYEDNSQDNEVIIRFEYEAQSKLLSVTICDYGIEFNPLEKSDVDIDALGESEAIGGLGIHLVKNTMDEVSYCRENGQNILTLKKKIKD